MKFFTVDITRAEALNLEGAELLVFSALSYLASNKPWKGSMEELAKMSRCGSLWTAQRAVKSLILKGYISRDEQGLCVVQNAQNDVQNAQDSVQNAQIPKRKEPKEKYINNNSRREDNNIRALPHENFGLKEILGVTPKPPKEPSMTKKYPFESFFNMYDVAPEYEHEKNACRRIWNGMPEEKRAAAVEAVFSGKKLPSPLGFLQNYEAKYESMGHKKYYETYKTDAPTDGWFRCYSYNKRTTFYKRLCKG